MITDLWVVFDGPPGPESGRFVEVEDSEGKSVGPFQTGVGWVHSEDGYWRLGPFQPSMCSWAKDEDEEDHGGEVPLEEASEVEDDDE